jgi:hypothetical protein
MTTLLFTINEFVAQPTLSYNKGDGYAIISSHRKEVATQYPSHSKGFYLLENVIFTTPIQQLYNNPSHESGSHTLGPTLI